MNESARNLFKRKTTHNIKEEELPFESMKARDDEMS